MSHKWQQVIVRVDMPNKTWEFSAGGQYFDTERPLRFRNAETSLDTIRFQCETSDGFYVDDRTVDSHIKRLRRKFRAADPEFGAIETLYGAGYSFSDG